LVFLQTPTANVANRRHKKGVAAATGNGMEQCAAADVAQIAGLPIQWLLATCTA
jgi:hypothetical protein